MCADQAGLLYDASIGVRQTLVRLAARFRSVDALKNQNFKLSDQGAYE